MQFTGQERSTIVVLKPQGQKAAYQIRFQSISFGWERIHHDFIHKGVVRLRREVKFVEKTAKSYKGRITRFLIV